MYHIVITLGSAQLAMEILNDRRYLSKYWTFSASNAIDVDGDYALEEIQAAFNEHGVEFEVMVAVEIKVPGRLLDSLQDQYVATL